MKAINVYGLANCDSTKKCLHLLKEKKLPVEFHDYKTGGISKEKLVAFCEKAGWETVLNKRGTTWRGLSKQEQESVKDQSSAISLMLKHNSLIKRPVIEYGKEILVGFNENIIHSLIKNKQ